MILFFIINIFIVEDDVADEEAVAPTDKEEDERFCRVAEAEGVFVEEGDNEEEEDVNELILLLLLQDCNDEFFDLL